MLVINWIAGAERMSRCPACHADGHKRHVLDAVFSATDDATTRCVALLHCDACGARYGDPLVSVDYQDIDQDGMRYYVEQGAGIDVMLDTFSALDGRPIKQYLEVGCSFGFAMAYARRSLGWEVLGFDPGFVAAAGKRMLGLPIETRLLDRDAVPRGAFDVVFCSEVIEHIGEPDAFVDILRHALSDRGILLMTTPDGDAVTQDQPSEMLAPILSPGQHVILYNAAAIERLLRRHGFADVRVRKNATQLQIVAAMTPLGKPASYFTRARYRQFLQDELDAHRDDRHLLAGLGYRLLCEDVNAGLFEGARATYLRLRDSYRATYGYDIDATKTVPIPSPAGLSLSAFGEQLPFNLCGVWYCRGIIAFLGDQNPAAAAGYFAAAIRVGGVLRAILNAIGTDDISVANFCQEAEIARLGALAQCDPQEGLRELQTLRQNTLYHLTPEADLKLKRAERQLFTDLVNLGHFALADQLVAGRGPLIAELLEASAAPTAIAYGHYVLNHKRDAAAAHKVFAVARRAVLAERATKPGDATLAGILQQVELGELAALAFAGSAASLAAMREVAANRGGLDGDVFAVHRARAASQLFTDLVNLGHYVLAEQLMANYGPPIDEPIEPDALPTAMAYGFYLLNHKQDAAAAHKVLAGARNVLLAEQAAGPDDIGLTGRLREIEIALLTAAALIGRAEAVETIEELSRDRAGLGDDASAAHRERVRRRAAELFADLGYDAED